ncbi:hypothetical protein BC936DRAFT_140376 [Jimgerdemannia flammicorona]|uniref:Uncharacterized protein n=1 Tax=Jimgerdemannia flammicorona TaxID=994334 RepID=A0A433AUE4_9FUNG|nr:hypothetical protein BC936DRAFT_140376 [Jimgerdemannia flammicorona]
MAMYQGLCGSSPGLPNSRNYLHISRLPPRIMFICQFAGTFVGCIINVIVINFVIERKYDILTGAVRDPTGLWVGNNPASFNTASIVWGNVLFSALCRHA